MPRKAFKADLDKAVAGVSIAGISNVEVGTDDGEFTFVCVADGNELKISCLIPELSDYPTSHDCMIYALDTAPASVAAILSDIASAAHGKTIVDILELVSNKLESTDQDGDQQMLNSQEFEAFEEDSDEYEEEYFPGDEDMQPKVAQPKHDNGLSEASNGRRTNFSSASQERIRRDLLVAKAEGFKVGHQGGLMHGLTCYVSLAVRIAKLGISTEAMQAWQLEPNEYLVAIFHFPDGYKSMDDFKSYDANLAKRRVGIRIGVSTSYKPTMQEAIQAFTVLSKEEEKRRDVSQATDSQDAATTPKGFRNSFISRPINEFLEQRFHLLLKYRYSGMPWQGAERFYNDQVNQPIDFAASNISQDQFYEPEPISTYPRLVTADHIQESTTNEHSFVLVGMQCILRRFVRCTEFCLICFTKLPDDLQALKPYVCENPLCLYQYMSLGFGPSIEHEIISQPKVVDILISFCYASTRLGRLRDFPSGLSLAVPPPESNTEFPVDQSKHRWQPAQPQPKETPEWNANPVPAQEAIKVKYYTELNELLFYDPTKPCPVNAGNWIAIHMTTPSDRALHCRVIDISLYPSIKVSRPVEAAKASANDPYFSVHTNVPATKKHPDQAPKATAVASNSKSESCVPASFYIYNQNFDDLPDMEKRKALGAILDLLPPVEEMREYLLRRSQSPLSSWVDRLSPAALGMLRWIIASNRACILQIDNADKVKNGRRPEDGVYGMAGWTQFRFAMGAPDKERRFVQAVCETSDRLKLKHPSLFAWHGSPIQNWHSIIREGLHFNDTLHGRAYGNGVYHALDVNTSLCYSGGAYSLSCWPNSELKIDQALALNEIVNAPSEFVSTSPHLVVAQLHWIQTRYLFVKTRQDVNKKDSKSTGKPVKFVEQDPNMTPRGTSDKLIIPIHAISGSRRPKAEDVRRPAFNRGKRPTHTGISDDEKQRHKRHKTTGSSQYDPIEIDCEDDDTASVATLEEDRVIFEGIEAEELDARVTESLPTPDSFHNDKLDKVDKGKSKIGGFMSKLLGSKSSKPMTDYVPGKLDYSTLPMLQMPAWATSSATKRLMKDFRDLIQVQNTTPAHELGWHIDEDKIENMYQWIVELHSFDPALPLAQDMKKRGIKSVVLELRFGKDYPMSPPFVRVIRPRFLGFQMGGGGHVTAGGAMCMQLLTNDGWSAVSSIESVLLQVRMAISSTDPKPARLEIGSRSDYGVGEAVEAYIRACTIHGWTVPAGFREMANGGQGVI